jgi:Zn-dependent protease
VAEQRSLGEELRSLRLATGLTIADLSARCRVREEYLTAIEENREEPSGRALQRIADQLDPTGATSQRLAGSLTAPEPDRTDFHHDRDRATTQRNTGIRLFEIQGITVFVHGTWFLAAFYELGSRQGRYSSPVWNVLEYLSLFAIVLLHELGHAFACRSVGGHADTIMLWPLGGVAFVKPPPRPAAMLWAIAAGPAVNVLLVPILGMAWVATAALGSGDDLHLLVRAVTTINLGLLLFNLLPVYPLDGGQIVGALLWFVVGRTRGLMITALLGFGGVAGLGLLAVRARSPWLGVITLFVGLQCIATFRRAQLANRVGRAARRDGFACPACDTKPPYGAFWPCSACGTAQDPFDAARSASEIVCRSCGTSIRTAVCFACDEVRPVREWQLSNRSLVFELPGGVVRFRPPEPPAATPVVFATCLSFFSATTMFLALRTAGVTPLFAVAMLAISVSLAARAAVLVARFRGSRREFERAIHQYQAGV